MKNIVLTLIMVFLTSFYINAQQQQMKISPHKEVEDKEGNSELVNLQSKSLNQENEIDLKKAIEMTIQSYPAIKQAEKLVGVAEARINQQNTTYSPNIDAAASYTRISPIPEFTFGGLSAALAPANNYDAHLSLQHTVYDFGRRKAQSELVRSYKTSAVDNIDFLKSNLAFQTIQTFYSVLFLRQSLQVKDEQIENLNKHMQVTQARIQSGSATDFDLSTTQVRLASVENQKIDIENEIRKQEVNLRSLLGLPSSSELNLKGDLQYLFSAVNADSLMNIANVQRSELKLAKDAEISAEKTKQTSHLSDMPSLGVGLSYGIKNGLEPNIDVLRGNWAAGVLFHYPIYNGQKSRSLEEESEANLLAAQAHTNEVELSIRTEINRAISDIAASQNQIQTVKVQVEHAKKALQRAELQYRDGIISNLDLLDVQTGLTEAQLSELQIAYRNLVSFYQLKKAVGDKVW